MAERIPKVHGHRPHLHAPTRTSLSTDLAYFTCFAALFLIPLVYVGNSSFLQPFFKLVLELGNAVLMVLGGALALVTSIGAILLYERFFGQAVATATSTPIVAPQVENEPIPEADDDAADLLPQQAIKLPGETRPGLTEQLWRRRVAGRESVEVELVDLRRSRSKPPPYSAAAG